jgi:hypothetical protein
VSLLVPEILFVKVSRATFLEACGLALLGARVDARTLRGILSSADGVDMAAVRSTGREGSRHGGPLRLQDATAPLFLQHLNTSFAVRSADGTRARLVLAKVMEHPVTRNVEQFSLIFHAPAGTAIRDGTHAFRHGALGEFNMFIVPVGASSLRRTVYQACFGRSPNARDAGEPTRREIHGSEPSPRLPAHGDAVQSALPRQRT